MPPYITFPQLNFRFNTGNINNLSNLDINVDAFSYVLMPRGRETLLTYITSFGVTDTSINTNTGNWPTGHDTLTYVSSPIANNAYFTTTNRVNVIEGDGSTDSNDWVIFNFGPSGGQDFGHNTSGDVDERYFGGETDLRSGGRGLVSGPVISSISGAAVTTGQIYGFGSAGWRLLYQLPLDNTNTGFNHANANWWNAGTTVTTGNGKRVEYDTYPITHVGFAVI